MSEHKKKLADEIKKYSAEILDSLEFALMCARKAGGTFGYKHGGRLKTFKRIVDLAKQVSPDAEPSGKLSIHQNLAVKESNEEVDDTKKTALINESIMLDTVFDFPFTSNEQKQLFEQELQEEYADQDLNYLWEKAHAFHGHEDDLWVYAISPYKEKWLILGRRGSSFEGVETMVVNLVNTLEEAERHVPKSEIRLTASWADGCAESSLTLSREDWDLIQEGGEFEDDSEFIYEGKEGCVSWYFKDRLYSIHGGEGRECALDNDIGYLRVEVVS